MTLWLDIEVAFLLANYGEMNARQIAGHLGKTRQAVHAMRKRMGLRMSKHQRSVACAVQHVPQRGELNHNWKGGVSREPYRYTGRYKIANPQKVRAHIAVHSAVKRGTIKRLPCSVCGSTVVQAHHEDYSRPLDVIWLCKTHHIEADNQRRQKEARNGDISADCSGRPEDGTEAGIADRSPDGDSASRCSRPERLASVPAVE